MVHGRYPQKWGVFWLCFIVQLCFAAPPSIIQSIQSYQTANTTKIKLVCANTPKLRYFILKNPTRLIVDVDNGRLQKPIDPTLFTGTLVKALRTGSHSPQVLRLVFETNAEISVTYFITPSNTAVFQLKNKNAAPLQTNRPTNIPPTAISPQNLTTNAPLGAHFSLQQDSLLGPIGQVKSSLSFNENQAAALELDGGAKVARVNATYGFALNDNNRVKLSAEYLLENLDFSFYSGDTRQWVDQGAIGASYQYLLGSDTLKSLEIGSHYSHAPSKNLSTKTIEYADGASLTDYRRIAGGDDWNGTADTALHLWPKGLLTLGGDYDRVRYDTEYSIQDGHDAQGFGGHIGLQQLLTSHTQLEAESTLSQLFNTYGATLNWIWASTAKTVLSAGLTSSYTQDHTTERHFWVNGINLNITWDTPQSAGKKPQFTEPQIATQSLSTWVQTPAVRMPDVLAISDERATTFTPITAACPASTEIQYNNATGQYSAKGGWYQSYPQANIPMAQHIAFDSANLTAGPPGAIACLYGLFNNIGVRTNLILENTIYSNATGTGANWQTGQSQYWPSTEPSPILFCYGTPGRCPFTTARPPITTTSRQDKNYSPK